MANCVRHEGIGETIEAKWPRRGSKFCTEACAGLYALEIVTDTVAPAIVTKDVGASLGHAKGHTTDRPPGDPRQPITRAPEPAPAPAPAPQPEPANEGGDIDIAPVDPDGIVQDDGLDEMDLGRLQSECSTLGIPWRRRDTKDDLIARIRDHHDAD
jgi:hypothetical protein